MPAPVTLLLGLGCLLISRSGLDLYPDKGLFQLMPQLGLIDLPGLIFPFELFLAVLVLGRRLLRLVALHLEVANLPLQKGIGSLEVTNFLLQGRDRRCRPHGLQRRTKVWQMT